MKPGFPLVLVLLIGMAPGQATTLEIEAPDEMVLTSDEPVRVTFSVEVSCEAIFLHSLSAPYPGLFFQVRAADPYMATLSMTHDLIRFEKAECVGATSLINETSGLLSAQPNALAGEVFRAPVLITQGQAESLHAQEYRVLTGVIGRQTDVHVEVINEGVPEGQNLGRARIDIVNDSNHRIWVTYGVEPPGCSVMPPLDHEMGPPRHGAGQSRTYATYMPSTQSCSLEIVVHDDSQQGPVIQSKTIELTISP